MYFGEMLRENSSLVELDLSATRMGSSAALVVADSLGRNTSLLRLRLDHNPLGEKGGRRLMLALNKNETLEEITLLGAQLNQAQQQLAAALKEREQERKEKAALKGAKKGKGAGKKGRAAPEPPPPPSRSKFNADDFNVQNPDGRYVLDLSNPVEFSVAAQLMDLEELMPVRPGII